MTMSRTMITVSGSEPRVPPVLESVGGGVAAATLDRGLGDGDGDRDRDGEGEGDGEAATWT